MDVIVRNVSPTAVKELDRMAKESKQSRQEFLKNELETKAFYQFNKNTHEKYEELIRQNSLVMEQCMETMQQQQQVLEELLQPYDGTTD